MPRKRAAARRQGGQNTSQPQDPQGAGSTSTTHSSGTQLRGPPVHLQAGANTAPDASLAPEGDSDDGFQVVTRRHRPIRNHDTNLDQLFSLLDEAVDDPRLDFYGIMAEISRVMELQRREEFNLGVLHAPGAISQGVTGVNRSRGNATGMVIADPNSSIPPAPDPTGGRRASFAPIMATAGDFHGNGEWRGRMEGPASGSNNRGQQPRTTVAQSQSNPPAIVPHRNIPPLVGPPPSAPAPPPPHSPVATPATNLPQVDLCKLAEDASVLLELYSKTAPDTTNDVAQQLIYSAYASVAKLNRHHRVLASGTGRGSIAAQKRPQNSDFTVDAGCIICYCEFADTVLLPCHHLVLCSVSD